ncbi:MAG: hypothetical protein HZB76_04230 [Chlamydiae bacterium]|nr:hypothetical protein [Chlamydiota bacterium]
MPAINSLRIVFPQLDQRCFVQKYTKIAPFFDRVTDKVCCTAGSVLELQGLLSQDDKPCDVGLFGGHGLENMIIFGHGEEGKFQASSIDAANLNKFKILYFVSCKTARYVNSIAYDIARKVNGIVFAPTEDCYNLFAFNSSVLGFTPKNIEEINPFIPITPNITRCIYFHKNAQEIEAFYQFFPQLTSLVLDYKTDEACNQLEKNNKMLLSQTIPEQDKKVFFYFIYFPVIDQLIKTCEIIKAQKMIDLAMLLILSYPNNSDELQKLYTCMLVVAKKLFVDQQYDLIKSMFYPSLKNKAVFLEKIICDLAYGYMLADAFYTVNYLVSSIQDKDIKNKLLLDLAKKCLAEGNLLNCYKTLKIMTTAAEKENEPSTLLSAIYFLVEENQLSLAKKVALEITNNFIKSHALLLVGYAFIKVLNLEEAFNIYPQITNTEAKIDLLLEMAEWFINHNNITQAKKILIKAKIISYSLIDTFSRAEKQAIIANLFISIKEINQAKDIAARCGNLNVRQGIYSTLKTLKIQA